MNKPSPKQIAAIIAFVVALIAAGRTLVTKLNEPVSAPVQIGQEPSK